MNPVTKIKRSRDHFAGHTVGKFLRNGGEAWIVTKAGPVVHDCGDEWSQEYSARPCTWSEAKTADAILAIALAEEANRAAESARLANKADDFRN